MPISLQQAQILVQLMQAKGVIFEAGLSDNEIKLVEERFGVIFPPDLAMLLQTALPVSEKFVPWREGIRSQAKADKIKNWLEQPLQGMLFDIEHNGYWFDDWGPQPVCKNKQIDLAVNYFHSYPKLIPIYAHRFIPSQPVEADNPIFSVYQMDIVYYGINLSVYLACEFYFDLPQDFYRPVEPKYINFWGDVVE